MSSNAQAVIASYPAPGKSMVVKIPHSNWCVVRSVPCEEIDPLCIPPLFGGVPDKITPTAAYVQQLAPFALGEQLKHTAVE